MLTRCTLRSSIFSHVPTNAQLILHILRVQESTFAPLPPPPPAPTAQHVKDEVSKTGLDPDGAETAEGGEVRLDGEGNAVVDDGEEGGDKGKGVTGQVVQTGKKTLLGGLRLAAKKAATFKADVSVDGAKAKVSLSRLGREGGQVAGVELMLTSLLPLTHGHQVGNKIDRMMYQSRAKDDESPECTSTSPSPSSSPH